jgi:hypothetical protein
MVKSIGVYLIFNRFVSDFLLLPLDVVFSQIAVLAHTSRVMGLVYVTAGIGKL